MIKHDPRVSLLSALVLIFAVSLVQAYLPLLALLIVCIILLHRRIKAVLKRLLAVNVFTVFIWLSLPFTIDNGVSLAMLYTLRINACALVFILFIAPMSISKLANAMLALRCPGKLVAILVLTHHCIYLMRARLSAALTAMQLRKPAGVGMIQLWYTYAALFVTAIDSAISRADRMQQAMLLRGFDGTIPATELLQWRRGDTLLIVFVVFVAAALYYGDVCFM